MEKQKNLQMLVIAVLSVALLTMSVGFAAFSSSLNVAGNVTVTGSSWDVAFDTDSYAESTGSVNVPTANRTITGTSVEYAVTLTKPGDFYEFTIDVANTGTFNANLIGVTMTSLTAEQSKYLTYKVSYGTREFAVTTSDLAILLGSKTGKEQVKVRLDYVQPDDPDDLPQSTVTIPLSATLNFEQAD